MAYFQNFPIILYSLDGGPPKVITNVMDRVKIKDIIKKNSSLYYPYSVKDSDTPESIASKYYGDPNRFWIVLLANDIVNPFYDWPLPYDVFVNYITGKYGSTAYAQSNVDHYEKWIAKTDSVTGLTTTTAYTIDLTTYNALPTTATSTVNLSDGTTVTVTVTKNLVYVWDQELALNEAKRNIYLIDSRFVPQIETELAAAFS